MLIDDEIKALNLLTEDISYENYFFRKVTNLKWFYPLKEKKFFRPEKNPYPAPADQDGYYSIPEWNILPYLERVSQQTNTPGNEKYIDELLTIIKDVSNYKDTSGQPIDNYRTWWYFTKILINLPNDKITDAVIDLILIWLGSKFNATLPGSEIATKLLPKFLTDNPEDSKKAEKIIDIITAINKIPLSEERAKILGKTEEARFVLDSYSLEETFKKYSEIIGEKCSKNVIEHLADKIKSLLKKEEDGTYESFYEEEEHLTSDLLEVLTFILKRILLSKAKSNADETKTILRDFLKDKFLYFTKMALYVMGQTLDKDDYRRLFWETFDTQIGNLVMANTLYFGDELKHLLKNLKSLTNEQRGMLNEKIENAIKTHDFKEDSERYVALSKQEIYEALSHDQYFRNLYEEMKKITKVDVVLHPAIGKCETHWGSGSPPFTKEEALKMPNDKLAEYLATFKTKDFWEGPTVGGLAELLAEIAKENPEKFIDNLMPFKDAGFIYGYEILKGVRDAWNGKKIFDWDKLFQFIELYIDRKDFWEDKFIVERGDFLGGANHQWISGMVAELIQDGTRDDSWAFSESHFEKAEKIIFLLLDNLKIEEVKEINDYITYTLNTPFGKALTALILLSLRIARVNKKGIKDEIKWEPKYKEKYDEMLKRQTIEGFSNLGRYMPNFYYLDKEWVKEKITFLDNEKGNNKYWDAFMQGYLSIGRVYEDLYGLMRSHYEYGLSHDFKERHDEEHLIQHICIGYLRDRGKLDDPGSLFKKVIAAWKPEQIKLIIGFFWMQRASLRVPSEENDKIRIKIIEFWRLLYQRYTVMSEDTLSREDKQILSATSKLASLLPQIDTESYKWLLLSAPYVHEDYNSAFFIEYLDNLKDKGDRNETANYIGDIYLKMLEKITPDFDQKNILSIVEFLYSSGAADSANSICNIYGSRGYEFLRDIYEKKQ